LEVGGETVAVRFLSTGGAEEAREYAEGFAAKPGMDGYEQFRAVSGEQHEDVATVAEYIPAKCLDDLTADEVSAISEDHLRGLVTIVKDGSEFFDFDHGRGNYLVSPQAGFKIVDYKAQKDNDPISADRALKGMIGAFSMEFPTVKEQTVEGYTEHRQLCEAFASTLQKLSVICADMFPGEPGSDLKAFAERAADMTRIAGRRYASAAAIAEQIALNETVITPELLEETSQPIDPEDPWPGGKVRFVFCHHTVENAPKIAAALDGCEGVLVEFVGGTIAQRASKLETIREALTAGPGTDDRKAKLASIAAGSEFVAELVLHLPESVRMVDFIDAAQGQPGASSEALGLRRHLLQGIAEGVSNSEVAARLESYARSRADNNEQRTPRQAQDIRDTIWAYGLETSSLGVVSGIMHGDVQDVISNEKYATEKVEIAQQDPISGGVLYTSREKMTLAFMYNPEGVIDRGLVNRGVLGSYFNGLMGGERWALPVLNRAGQKEIDTVLKDIGRLKAVHGRGALPYIAEWLEAWYEVKRANLGLPSE
jgi:hypothetical protein